MGGRGLKHRMPFGSLGRREKMGWPGLGRPVSTRWNPRLLKLLQKHCCDLEEQCTSRPSKRSPRRPPGASSDGDGGGWAGGWWGKCPRSGGPASHRGSAKEGTVSMQQTHPSPSTSSLHPLLRASLILFIAQSKSIASSLPPPPLFPLMAVGKEVPE